MVDHNQKGDNYALVIALYLSCPADESNKQNRKRKRKMNDESMRT